ncbi:MAG: alpha/beta fold hydrolase [Solirubrobacteraceae bacterium]
MKLTNTPCLSGLANKPKGWSYQAARFVEGKTIPNVVEVLATGAQVGPVWKRLGDALAGCRSSTLVLGSIKARATVRPMVFPRVGDSSSAYAWAFRIAGIGIRTDLVLFKTGRYAGYLSYSDLGAPLTSTVEAFVRAAVAKAQSRSMAPVPDAVSIASATVQIARTSLGAVGYRAIGTGPPLLLITGYSGTMEGWDPRFVNALAQHHRVIIFDNAGIGKTERLPAPLTIDAMANQTSALLHTLALPRTDVLGWAMGSMIAQALAVSHPNQVHRLILCATYPGSGATVPPAQHAIHALTNGSQQKLLADLFPAGHATAGRAWLAALSAYPVAAPVPAPILAAQRNAVTEWWNGTDPAGKQASTITVPTLVADGTLDRIDPLANSRAVARLIHGSILKLYPQAGHAFMIQDQTAFIPLVESFLRAVS